MKQNRTIDTNKNEKHSKAERNKQTQRRNKEPKQQRKKQGGTVERQKERSADGKYRNEKQQVAQLIVNKARQKSKQ